MRCREAAGRPGLLKHKRPLSHGSFCCSGTHRSLSVPFVQLGRCCCRCCRFMTVGCGCPCSLTALFVDEVSQCDSDVNVYGRQFRIFLWKLGNNSFSHGFYVSVFGLWDRDRATQNSELFQIYLVPDETLPVSAAGTNNTMHKSHLIN